MKKSIIVFFLLMLSSSFLMAQDSMPHHAQPDSVIKLVPVEVGSHISYLYTINGKIKTPEDIKIKLLAYAPSAEEYHKAKTSAIWTGVSLGGFALSSIAAVIEYATHNKSVGETTGLVNGQPGFIYQYHSLTGAYIFTGLASAFLVSTVINYIYYKKHADKSLKLYNSRFE